MRLGNSLQAATIKKIVTPPFYLISSGDNNDEMTEEPLEEDQVDFFFPLETFVNDPREFSTTPLYRVFREEDILNPSEVREVKALVKPKSWLRFLLATLFSTLMAALWIAGSINSIYMLEMTNSNEQRIAELERQIAMCSCPNTVLTSAVLQTSPTLLPLPGAIHSSY